MHIQVAEVKVNKQEVKRLMKQALEFMDSMDKAYIASPLEAKQGIIGSIFTGKLFFEENQIRTTELNSVVELVCKNKRVFSKMKKGQPANLNMLSSVVYPSGIEPLY